MAAPYNKKSYEEKKEEIQALIDQMEQSIEKYYESPEQMKEYLRYMSQFYQYSYGNVSLIQKQFDGARAVGSFQFWKEKGYSVKKGEKGIKIFVPQSVQAKFQDEDGTWKPVKEATDHEKQLIEQNKLKSMPNRTVFGIGHVFDVSQTNCPEADLPKIFPNKWIDGEIQNYKGFMDSLHEVADSIGFKIEPPKYELGAAKGVCYPLVGVISLNPRNSELQNATTLIHELAHAKLHTIDKFLNYTTPEKEFQAEMVSYAVSAYFGLENENGDKEAKSLSYISNWTKGRELKDKAQLLKEVRETTHEFISLIEKSFTKEKNQEVIKSQDMMVEKNDTLYWYEMLNRPVDMGCQPKGFVETKDDQGRHGLVAYSRQLTEKELDEFEMRKWEEHVYLLDLTDTHEQQFKKVPLSGLKKHYEKDAMADPSFIQLFNEVNKERYFILPEENIKEPMVLIRWSEHKRLESSQLMPLTEANQLFKELNQELNQQDGCYDKTRYSLILPHKEEGIQLVSPDRHDLGDGLYVDIMDQLKKDCLLQPNQEKMVQSFFYKKNKEIEQELNR